MISDADIQAYVDGELGPVRRAKVDNAAAADPNLAAEIERRRRLREAMQAAFDPVLEEPLPPHMLATIARGPRPAEPEPKRRRTWLPAGAALAAGLALWVFAAVGFNTLASHEPISAGPSGLRAEGALARALDRRPAGETGGEAEIVLSFAQADGTACRAFALPARALSGLACRADGRWRIEALATTGTAAATRYRQASSATPPEILAAVDARIAGEAFDAAQDAAWRARGWRATAGGRNARGP